MTDYICMVIQFQEYIYRVYIVSNISVEITLESQFFDQYFTFSKQIPVSGLHTYINKEVNVEG